MTYVGQRPALAAHLDGAGSQADYTDDSRWLGYDGLDRLTVANSRDQNARMQWGYGWGDGGFEYDALDNLRRFQMGPLDLRYHYDSQQRLQGITFGGVGFRSYAHNARGQMTQREHADRLYSLSWDSAHRLLSTQAPGHSESYRYDAHGHRVRTQRSGETVWSVYSRAGTLLFEQTSLGQNRRHIHLGARQVAETRNGQRRYLHTDHLGTPRVQTDAFGTVVQRDVRAPYGSVLAGFDYRQGAGFTGHMEDGATALTYMKARYYDPVAMRFLSPDPVYVDLGTGGNFNRYWYANNNPYTNWDPDGRACDSLSGGGCGQDHRGRSTVSNDSGQAMAVVGVVADFTPVIGDAKAVLEAYHEPTPVNIAAAIVGMVPILGDVAAKSIKATDAAVNVGTVHVKIVAA